MSLVKQTKTKTMTFGENRDTGKVLTSTASVSVKRLNFNIDEEKHTRFKAACTRQRTTISDVLSDFVDKWLAENENK
jgi:hypothetical protein